MVASSAEQAIANGRQHSTYPAGYCQKFVRLECWGVGSLYGSAIEAWNGARDKHPGDRTPPAGAPCYYRGGQYGHAVCFTYDAMRSTDCTSTGRVSEEDIGWPERAWGYEYLGWTGDINGVDLPLEQGEEDMPLSDDDITKIAKRVNMVLGDYDAEGDQRDKGDPAHPDHADVRLRQIENAVRDLAEKVDKILSKL